MNEKESIEKEILGLRERLAELEKKQQAMNGKVEIEWEGKCDRRQHGKPYLAIITRGENGKKYIYDFLPTIDVYADRKGHIVSSKYRGSLPVGIVLRGRTSSSWKNDYTYFYVVTKEGLKQVDEGEILGILK